MKPWVVNESVEIRAAVEHRESDYDEKTAEGDRREEAERRHVPARPGGTLARQTRKRARSDSG